MYDVSDQAIDSKEKKVDSPTKTIMNVSYTVLFSRLLILFQNQIFRKILSGIPSRCQTDWIQIRPDILSGLIWVQSVSKGYQQMALVGNELIVCERCSDEAS